MMAWSRSPMVRSGPSISAIFASTSLSPPAFSASAFSSLARSLIAARPSSVNPLDFLPVAVVLLADFCVAFFVLIVPSCAGSPMSYPDSPVLKQPEDIAIGVGDGGHQAAATDVVRGLLHGGARGSHLGQLRFDVRYVPVGHRRGHAPRPAARHQPDVLARDLEADVVGLIG